MCASPFSLVLLDDTSSVVGAARRGTCGEARRTSIFVVEEGGFRPEGPVDVFCSEDCVSWLVTVRVTFGARRPLLRFGVATFVVASCSSAVCGFSGGCGSSVARFSFAAPKNLSFISFEPAWGESL